MHGAFNPAIVTPGWLAAKHLIDEADREYVMEPEAGRMIVTPLFSGGQYPWIIVEVSREDLDVASTEETETPERLREFVVRLLTILPETPVEGLRVRHYWHLVTGPDVFESIAQAIAPAAPWHDLAGDSTLEKLVRHTRLEDGHVVVEVEPSYSEGYDLYVAVERYWEFEDGSGVPPFAAVEVLDGEWVATLELATKVREGTLGMR